LGKELAVDEGDFSDGDEERPKQEEIKMEVLPVKTI